ncbi:Sin3 associated polypeptide p18-domain-containing protein [Pilobolus umbonatus]|nr:Sin3 associated polypeptide p18-domain-containing protein [Pilobolus umbonatus]
MSTVDREKVCPFLLRVFIGPGRHNKKNATLEEIAQLISEVNPEAQHPDARLSFRLVYLDSQNARYSTRELGRVYPAHPTPEQTKTLEDFRFFIGDYLDVAIFIGPPPMNKRRIQGRHDASRFNGRPEGKRFNSSFVRDNNNRFSGGRQQRRGDRF